MGWPSFTKETKRSLLAAACKPLHASPLKQHCEHLHRLLRTRLRRITRRAFKCTFPAFDFSLPPLPISWLHFIFLFCCWEKRAAYKSHTRTSRSVFQKCLQLNSCHVVPLHESHDAVLEATGKYSLCRHPQTMI